MVVDVVVDVVVGVVVDVVVDVVVGFVEKLPSTFSQTTSINLSEHSVSYHVEGSYFSLCWALSLYMATQD